jgi:membrane protein
MDKLKRLIHAVDRAQQTRSWLAVAVGTYKKFGDDQAGNLAALIAYYAFASIFPLLLVLVTVLDIVLKNDASLRNQVLHSALSQYPVIGTQLTSNVSGLHKTGLALVIGLVLTFLGARGVANAMQNALNSVWEVPMSARPGFPWGILRSVGLILVIGPGIIATIVLSSVAGGTGHLGGVFARIAATVVSLVLNIGLFWLGFRLATAKEVSFRDLRLSAILAAVAWQILQLVGGYFIGHQLASNSAYGAFAVVLGLLAWFYLQAQLTLYMVELNVVRRRRLWPRSLVPPPLTEADLAAYQLYAQAGQRRNDVEILVRERPEDTGADSGEPGTGKPETAPGSAAADPAAADPAAAQLAGPNQADQAAADQAAAQLAAEEVAAAGPVPSSPAPARRRPGALARLLARVRPGRQRGRPAGPPADPAAGREGGASAPRAERSGRSS